MLCLWNKNSNLNGNNWNYHILLYDWNDITWWRHQMETFSALLALCTGNSPVTGEFPSQRPMTRNFVVYFDLRLNKRLSKWWGWDLRRHCAHHDVTVIKDQYVTGVRSLDMRVFSGILSIWSLKDQLIINKILEAYKMETNEISLPFTGSRIDDWI